MPSRHPPAPSPDVHSNGKPPPDVKLPDDVKSSGGGVWPTPVFKAPPTANPSASAFITLLSGTLIGAVVVDSFYDPASYKWISDWVGSDAVKQLSGTLSAMLLASVTNPPASTRASPRTSAKRPSKKGSRIG